MTHYPELEKTKEELALLDKLYNLYTTVLATVTEFNDMAWVDVCSFDEKNESMISKMTKKLEEFQLACKKMPKELRAWDAYVELKKMVDDFLETLPLVEQLANPALRPRHWQALEELTKAALPYQAEGFHLADLLGAGILEVAEDVEEIAGSAVKELAIEGKLNDIASDWDVRVLSFAPFKTRGNIASQHGRDGRDDGGARGVADGPRLDARLALCAPLQGDGRRVGREALGHLGGARAVDGVQAMWQYLEAVFTSRRHRQAAAAGVKALPGHRQELGQDHVQGQRGAQRVNYICGQRRAQAAAAAHARAARALPEGALRLPRPEARRLPALLLRGRRDAARGALPGLQPAGHPAAPAVVLRLGRVRRVRQEGQDAASRCCSRPKGRRSSSSTGEGRGQHRGVARQAAQGDAEHSQPHHLVRRLRLRGHGHRELTHKYQAQVSLIGIQFKWTSDSEDALYRAKSEKGILKAVNKKHQQRLTDLVAINMRPDAELRAFGAWTRKKVETMIVVDVHQRDVFVDLELTASATPRTSSGRSRPASTGTLTMTSPRSRSPTSTSRTPASTSASRSAS